jgi:hypothetical protein
LLFALWNVSRMLIEWHPPQEISRGMLDYSDKLRRQLENKWKSVMDRMWGEVPGRTPLLDCFSRHTA